MAVRRNHSDRSKSAFLLRKNAVKHQQSRRLLRRNLLEALESRQLMAVGPQLIGWKRGMSDRSHQENWFFVSTTPKSSTPRPSRVSESPVRVETGALAWPVDRAILGAEGASISC
jgi:hypothetical protein